MVFKEYSSSGLQVTNFLLVTESFKLRVNFLFSISNSTNFLFQRDSTDIYLGKVYYLFSYDWFRTENEDERVNHRYTGTLFVT